MIVDSSPTGGGESANPQFVNLAVYRSNYDCGRGFLVQVAWYFVSLALFENGWFPCSKLKSLMLRVFGARIGAGLVLKTHVRIKYPWRLTIGEHCWIGQDAWIDNLADVRLGDHVCISQGAYLCTGSHDHSQRTFDLVTRPISVESGAWVGAKSVVLPGTTIGTNAIVAAGTVVRGDVTPAIVIGGSANRELGERRVNQDSRTVPYLKTF
jgi:putative colanic acid biosynthesis acetyltransferase WcaF